MVRVLSPFLLAALLALLASAPSWAGATTATPGPPTFLTYVAPALSGADDAAGPSLGVDWPTGHVTFQTRSSTLHVAFDDTFSPAPASWAVGSPPGSLPATEKFVFTDGPTGRTWFGQVVGACTLHAFRDPSSASWTQGGSACAGTGFPSIASARGVPRVVYSCAYGSTAQCARSDDGGLAFQAPVPVSCGSVGASGIPGDVHVGPTGVVYLPFTNCGGSAGVALSRNNGLTWSSSTVPGAFPPSTAFEPDVATSTGGTAWLAYPTSGWGVGVARSTTHGTGWTNLGDVAAAAGVRSSAFHEMVAGDATRAAVVYLGSTTDGNPHASSFAGSWRAYVTYTLDGGATWTTTLASPNLFHRGWICAGGSSCGDAANLGDAIGAEIAADGRIVIALADGCVATCETGAGASRASWATLLRQSDGDDMFAAV